MRRQELQRWRRGLPAEPDLASAPSASIAVRVDSESGRLSCAVPDDHRTCVMVILSVRWGHSSRARRLLCLHGIICRCNVTKDVQAAELTARRRSVKRRPGPASPVHPSCLVRWRSSDSMSLSSALYGCPWGPCGASWEARGDVVTSDFFPDR